MNSQIKEMLEFDPLLMAERVTGKSYKEDKGCDALGLLFALEHNKVKAEVLRENHDTCMSNNLTQQLEVIDDLGFKLLHCADIPGTEDK